jgi:DNA-directed RNA polymerase specialized sigma54-like protein
MAVEQYSPTPKEVMMEREETAAERHPLRFMMKLAVLAGLLYGAGRFLAGKKSEFADLTETQARDRLMEKISPRLGEDTANEIADQVIPKLKERGLIKADPMDEAAEEIKEAADKVSEAVDSVVKD